MKSLSSSLPVLFVVCLTASTFTSCASSDFSWENQQRLGRTNAGQAGFVPLQADTSVVSVGDSLILSVWDYPQFNTRATVRLNGSVLIPLVGEIQVAGNKKDEVMKGIRRKLADYIKGEVLLHLEVNGPIPKIVVLGMVPTQGSLQVNSELSLIDVFSRVGGWTDAADIRYIKITRPSASGLESSVLEVDLTMFLETGDVRGLPFVRPGDIVYVPKRVNYVREFSSFVQELFLLFGFFRIFN